MSTTKKSATVFYLLIVCAILGFTYWVMVKNSNPTIIENESITKQDLKVETKNSLAKEQSKTKGLNIYYALLENNATKIYLKSDSENKLIYRDSDESNKVQKTYKVANNKIIIVESNNLAYKINSLSINGSGKKESLSSDIFSASVPEVNANADSILTTTFSNVEKDYGYSLFFQNVMGANKRKISPTTFDNIISPRFSFDSKKIAYITTKNSSDSKIFVYQDTSSVATQIYSTPMNIFELAWLGDDLVFSATKSKPIISNAIELYQLSIASQTVKQLTNDKDCEKNLISVDNDLNIIYINSNEPQNNISQVSGTPEDLKKAIDFKVIKASYIVDIK